MQLYVVTLDLVSSQEGEFSHFPYKAFCFRAVLSSWLWLLRPLLGFSEGGGDGVGLWGFVETNLYLLNSHKYLSPTELRAWAGLSLVLGYYV